MYRNPLSEYDELGKDPRQIEPPKSLTVDEMFDLLHLNASRGIGCPQKRPDFSIDESYHTEPPRNLPQNPHSSSFGCEIPRSTFPWDHFMKDIVFTGIDSKKYGSALPLHSVKCNDTACSHGELKSSGFCSGQASFSHPDFTATNSTLISPAVREPLTRQTSTRICSLEKVDSELGCGFDEVWNNINRLSNAAIGVQLETTDAATYQNRDSSASCAPPHTKTHVGICHDHQPSKDTIDLAFTEMLNKHPSTRESFGVTTSSRLVAPIPTMSTSGERNSVPCFNPLHPGTTNHTSSHNTSTHGHKFPGSKANLPEKYQQEKVCNLTDYFAAGSGISEPVTRPPRGNSLLLGPSFHGLPQLNSTYHCATSQNRMPGSASLPQIRNRESNFWLPGSSNTKSSASAPQPHSHQKTNISDVPQIITHDSNENLQKSIKFLEDEMGVISRKINQLKVNGKSLIEEKNKLVYKNKELQSDKKDLKDVIVELEHLLKYMEREVTRLKNNYNSSVEEMTRITLQSKELKFENQFLKASTNTLEGLVRKMEVEIASQADQLAIHQMALVQEYQDSVVKTNCIVCGKSIVSTTWSLNEHSPECPECFLTRLISGKAPGWEFFQTLDPLCEYLKKQYEAVSHSKSTGLSNATVFESPMLKPDSGSAPNSSIGDLVDSLQNLLNVAEKFKSGPIDNLVKSMASVMFIQNLFSGSNSLKDQHLTSDFDIMNCVHQGLKHAKKNQHLFSQPCINQSSLKQPASQEPLKLDLDHKTEHNDLSESSGHSMMTECFYDFEKQPQESDEKVSPPLLSSGMFGEKLSKILEGICGISGDLSSADQNWEDFTSVKDRKACSLSQSVVEKYQVDVEALKEINDFNKLLDCTDSSFLKIKEVTVGLDDASKSESDFYIFDDAKVAEFLRTFKTMAPPDYVDVDLPKIRTRHSLCNGLTGAGKKKVSMTVESVPTSPIIAATKSYNGPGILDQEEVLHCSPNIVEPSRLRNVHGSKTQVNLATDKLNSGTSVAGSSATEKSNFNLVDGPSTSNHRAGRVCKLSVNQPGVPASDDMTTLTKELIEKPKAQRLNGELVEGNIKSKDIVEVLSDDLIPGMAVEKIMAEVLVESTSSISSRRSSTSDDSWETL